VASFLDELLKQGVQVQFRPHPSVRQNRESAIGFALKVPADNFRRVTLFALLALSSTLAALAGRTTAAGSA
jgi:hypothetical protein